MAGEGFVVSSRCHYGFMGRRELWRKGCGVLGNVFLGFRILAWDGHA